MRPFIKPVYEREDFESKFEEYDYFGRKSFAENLTRLFKNSESGLVLTIDSKWGDGKTTFIKYWQKHLEKIEPHIIPIYYDAFKNDFTNDVFMSIGVEIYRALYVQFRKCGKDPENNIQLKKLKEKSIELGKSILKTSISSGINYLSSGLIPGGKITEALGDGVKNLLFDTLEHRIGDKFEAHLKAESQITDYQQALKNILKSSDDIPSLKIVFFVDELDRCRPTFSIEVIEKIKHLFNIDNTFFILVINKSQLQTSIKQAYGVENTDIYLEKFVHLYSQLPPIDEYNQIRAPRENAIAYYKPFIKQIVEDSKINSNYNDLVIDTLADASLSFDLNPRSIKRIMTLIVVAACTIDKTLFDSNFKILLPLAIAKLINYKAFENYKKNGSINISSPQGGPDPKNFLFEYYRKHNMLKSKSNSQIDPPEIKEACKILDIYMTMDSQAPDPNPMSTVARSEPL